MTEIYLIIIHFLLIQIFFSNLFLFYRKNLFYLNNPFYQNVNYFSYYTLLIINILFFLSFFNINYYYIFYSVLIFNLACFIINFNRFFIKINLFNINIISLFGLILSIILATNLKLGWDAQEVQFIKALIFFQDGNFFDLKYSPQNNYPHLGSFLWAFFWKVSFLKFEYLGRFFYIFYYLSALLIIINIVKSYYYKSILFIFLIFLTFKVDYFAGYQEIILFSTLIIASKFLLEFKKNNYKKNISLYFLIINILIWTKQEGIFISLILSILIIKKISDNKYKFFYFIVFILLLIFQIFLFKYSTGDFSFQTSNYSALINHPLNNILDLYRHIKINFEFIKVIIQTPLILIFLLLFIYKLFLSNNFIKIISKFNNDFFIFFVLYYFFIYGAYLFSNNVAGLDYHVETSMQRVAYSSSGFYLIYCVNFFLKIFTRILKTI